MDTYLFPLLGEEKNSPFYVKGVGGLKNQVHILRPDGYPDYQWLHCIKGSGKLYIKNREYIIKKNTGFLMRPHIPHEYMAMEEPWETHWVTFNGSGVPSLLDALNFKDVNVHSFTDINIFDSIIYDIFMLSQSKNLMSGFRRSAKLFNLLIEISNSIKEAEESAGIPGRQQLEPVITYIEENFAGDIGIKDMAAAINASPQYLCRLFGKTLHMRPFVYLNTYRIQRAKEMLLKDFNLPVGQIAKMAGYNNPSYFCSVFKKHEGLTPQEFRKIHSDRGQN